jgi:hypothetical protein
MWGEARHVTAAVDAHNAVIRELAQQYDHAVFVDQNGLIPKDGRHFVDACHFAPDGCDAFVDNLIPPLVERLKPRLAASAH